MQKKKKHKTQTKSFLKVKERNTEQCTKIICRLITDSDDKEVHNIVNHVKTEINILFISCFWYFVSLNVMCGKKQWVGLLSRLSNSLKSG